MKLVSPLLKRAVYPALSRCGYLRRATPHGTAVVTYHGVLPPAYRSMGPLLDGNLVSAAMFRRQLELLKNRYRVIRPEEFLKWCEGRKELPSQSVLLTCDDCLQNVLSEMLPILREMDLSCIFFATGASLTNEPELLWYERLYLMFLCAPEGAILELEQAGPPAQRIGRQGTHSMWWNLVQRLSAFDFAARSALLVEIQSQLGLKEGWDRNIHSDAAQRSRFLVLKVTELRELADAGMCIGAHTLSHPVLSLADADLAWVEISEGRRRIEQASGSRVWSLAYPFGGASCVSAREFELAARAGYQCAFLNVGGGFGAEMPRFAIPRVHVTGDMGLSEFEARISGFYNGMRRFFGQPDEAAGLFRHARLQEVPGSVTN
jgi:peptidoglycan/xylan/chitin deacetylase (PgdA/CDA1 family)